MSSPIPCPSCGRPTAPELLQEARQYAFWRRPDGACPACVQQRLLLTLLREGDEALHRRVQTAWPLDAGAAFGALPTPLRLHADPRYTGRGVTLAFVDSGFFPHADLTRPANRIRAWVDAGQDPVQLRRFNPDETPAWPDWDGGHSWQWHGLMTSACAAGNGFLSHGLYRGLASEAELVLIQARDENGAITNATIARALQWLGSAGRELGVRVVNLSVAGEAVTPLAGNEVDRAVATLAEQGIAVVAAAGNDGQRRLVPPATAPRALTVGGLDDHNVLDHATMSLWHSNYGSSSQGGLKPELVAPSIWVVAPILPGTAVAAEAATLLSWRDLEDPDREARISALKLVSPHYQHADGTSFAAPIVASAIAGMVEASPGLSPSLIRDILRTTAYQLPGVPVARQGWGVLEAGPAVSRALRERHPALPPSPWIGSDGVVFALHDHQATAVQVLGSWNGWSPPGLAARAAGPGLWQTTPLDLPPGEYGYKFLLDSHRWLDDPANPHKVPDNLGGFNAVLIIN